MNFLMMNGFSRKPIHTKTYGHNIQVVHPYGDCFRFKN